MRISQCGSKIGIMTSDGFVKCVNRSEVTDQGNKLKTDFIFAGKRHRMPVTSMGFRHDPLSGEAEWVLSGSSDYTYNMISCKKSFIGKY